MESRRPPERVRQDAPIRQRIIENALERFRENGYAETSMQDIGRTCGLETDELFRHFGRKEAIVLTLYHRLAGDLEAEVADLPEGGVGARFAAIMMAKLDLLSAHRDLLTRLLGPALDPADRLGALSAHTTRIRTRVTGVFEAVVRGADDCPGDAESFALTRTLYGLHLAIILLWLQQPSEHDLPAHVAIQLVSELLTLAGPLLAAFPAASDVLGRFDQVFGVFVQPPHDDSHQSLAENILRRVFLHRRTADPHDACRTSPCPQCYALHLAKVEEFVGREQPILMVLPGFPAKSANRQKTLGPMPDLGEELSLRFLQELCEEITALHSPGARIVICSDGRVFNDLVGVTDQEVSDYRAELADMIQAIGADSLELFDLDDIIESMDHESARQRLVEQYGQSLYAVTERCNTLPSQRSLFNGIHRFLFEDQAALQPDASKTQVRAACKPLTYRVIQRSDAWSRLVAEVFPDAVRLSIHPQHPHGEKIGLQLTHGEDNWITPWHGCLLFDAERYTLVRRSHAEERGAHLVLREERPSYYELPRGKEA